MSVYLDGPSGFYLPIRRDRGVKIKTIAGQQVWMVRHWFKNYIVVNSERYIKAQYVPTNHSVYRKDGELKVELELNGSESIVCLPIINMEDYIEERII